MDRRFKPKTNKICKVCGIGFIVTPSRINRTCCSRKCSIENLKKTPSWCKNKKLHYDVWNKGTKGVCKPNKTSFKKGQRPKNYNGGFSFYQGRWHIVCRDETKVTYSRVLIEGKLKRHLKSSEIVHHINHDKSDDRIENLLITNRKDHMNHHRKDLINGMKKRRKLCHH